MNSEMFVSDIQKDLPFSRWHATKSSLGLHSFAALLMTILGGGVFVGLPTPRTMRQQPQVTFDMI